MSLFSILLPIAAAAAVIGLYLLRPPPVEVVVPSTLLWQRLLEERGRRSDLLRWLLSLLLALAIALGMALAIGRSPLASAGSGAQLAIVIDNSTSMAARGADGRTRFERARSYARELISEQAGAVLLADTCGQLAAIGAAPVAALRRLDRLEVCVGQPVSFPLLPPASDAVFLSDGVAALAPPAAVRTVSVFEPVDNVGFSRVGTRPLPGRPERSSVFFELRNDSERSRPVELEIRVGQERRTTDLRLAAGARLPRALELDRGGEPLRLTLRSAGDRFPFDDRVEIPLPAAPPFRVGLATPGNRALETLLELDPRIELLRVSGDDSRSQAAADGPSSTPVPELLILDRVAPQLPPSLPALLIAPPDVEWLPPTGHRLLNPETVLAAPEHPVLAGLSLADLEVGSSRRIGVDDYRVLIGRPGAPLLLAHDASPRRLLVSFELADSNLAQRREFPALVRNALAWLRPAPEVRSVALGPLALEAPAPDARVERAGGEPVAAIRWGERLLVDLERPGIYRLMAGGRPIELLSAGLAGIPLATGINRSRLGSAAADPPLGSSRDGDRRSLLARVGRAPFRLDWRLLVVTALALVLIEWWTYHRRLSV